MTFVKIDCGMLDSTTWLDKPARDMMITALLMAVPLHIKEPTAQLEVGSLKETGWKVPPGDYGFVKAAGPAIAVRAQVALKIGMAALERLGAPERESRSSEFGGRRIVRVDGGYLILNYDRYRQRDDSSAERTKRWREREAEKQAKERDASQPSPRRHETRHVTQEEVEVEVRSNKTKKTKTRAARAPSQAAPAPADVSPEVWNDFKTLRTKQRAPITATAMEGIQREAVKAGVTLEEALRTCCERSWRGFKAEWLVEKVNGRPAEEPSRYARPGLKAKLEADQARAEAEWANGQSTLEPTKPPLTPEEEARRKREISRSLDVALGRAPS